MLCGVATEAVDTEVFHPSGKPVDDVVGRRALAIHTPILKIGQTVIIIISTLLLTPLFGEERRNIDRGVTFGHDVGQTRQ